MLYKIILCAPTILCLFHCCEFMSTRKRRVVDFSFECQFQSIHVEINLSWINEWQNFPKHLLYEFLVLPFKKLNFFIFFTRSDARCNEEYLSFISIVKEIKSSYGNFQISSQKSSCLVCLRRSECFFLPYTMFLTLFCSKPL